MRNLFALKPYIIAKNGKNTISEYFIKIFCGAYLFIASCFILKNTTTI